MDRLIRPSYVFLAYLTFWQNRYSVIDKDYTRSSIEAEDTLSCELVVM